MAQSQSHEIYTLKDNVNCRAWSNHVWLLGFVFKTGLYEQSVARHNASDSESSCIGSLTDSTIIRIGSIQCRLSQTYTKS